MQFRQIDETKSSREINKEIGIRLKLLNHERKITREV